MLFINGPQGRDYRKGLPEWKTEQTSTVFPLATLGITSCPMSPDHMAGYQYGPKLVRPETTTSIQTRRALR